MNRRSFLGSIIGLVASGPFVAKAWEQQPEPIYQVLVHDKITDTTFVAPKVHCLMGDFKCEDLNVKRAMELDYCILMYDNTEISRGPFARTICVCSGDTVRISMSLIKCKN